MSKARSLPPVPTPVPASRLVWNDEKLDALATEQLTNLLQNLATQVRIGRVTEEAATDLEARIRARLPARAGGVRKRKPANAGKTAGPA